jgi:hypothetical protein
MDLAWGFDTPSGEPVPAGHGSWKCCVGARTPRQQQAQPHHVGSSSPHRLWPPAAPRRAGDRASTLGPNAPLVEFPHVAPISHCRAALSANHPLPRRLWNLSFAEITPCCCGTPISVSRSLEPPTSPHPASHRLLHCGVRYKRLGRDGTEVVTLILVVVLIFYTSFIFVLAIRIKQYE